MFNEVNLIFLALVPAMAALAEGIYRKLTARMQNRAGPSVLQPFYDLAKLSGKKRVENDNDMFFNAAAFLYALSTYSLFILVPFAIMSFNFDFILLIYITILESAFFVLAGISSDSPYSIVGAMREMKLMLSYETALAVAIFCFAIASKSFTLEGMGGMLFVAPLACLALFVAAAFEIKLKPFDTVTAETEILDSYEVEYSGMQLMMLELAKYMKKFFYALFIPLMLFGNQGLWLYAAAVLGTLFAFALMNAYNPRHDVKNSSRIMTIILALALLDFIRLSVSP